MTSFDRWLRKAIASGLMSFERCNLSGAYLSGCNLSYCNLYRADLSGADLSGAYLSGAYLSEANLRWANLCGCDLTEAKLSEADLRGADLSDCKGLLDAREWIAENFASDAEGIIVYKRIGCTDYQAPSHWEAQPGAVLTEVCNPCRTTDCGCGVNFGTEAWCRENYKNAVLWRCRIEWLDLAGVVVPYRTDGKARCSRLVLLEAVA